MIFIYETNETETLIDKALTGKLMPIIQKGFLFPYNRSGYLIVDLLLAICGLHYKTFYGPNFRIFVLS